MHRAQRKRLRSTYRGVATLAVGIGVASSAAAHGGHVPLRAERTIKLEADGEVGLRIVVTISLGAEEMLRRARRADDDGDGAVSEPEARAFLDDWIEDLRREIPVRIDSGYHRVDYREAFFEPKGPIRLAPGTLEVVGFVTARAGEHTVFVTDEAAADAFERTDVIYTASNGATLLASGPTDAPTEIVPSFAYGPTTERRRIGAIGMRFEMPLPPEGELPRRRPYGLLRPVLFLSVMTGFNVVLGRLLRAIRERNRRARSG